MTSDDPDEPRDAPALVALTELGRDAAQPHAPSALDQGLNAVRARVARGQVRRRSLRRFVLFGATSAVCLVVAVKVVSIRRDGGLLPEPPVVVSRIEGGTELEGGYL